jgi:hypothetical protein
MQAGDTRASGSPPLLVRLGRIVGWLAGVALVLFVLDLLGVPVADWIREWFKQVRAVPAGAVVLLVLVGRYFWHRATKLRDDLKSGGAILGQPRRFAVGLALPAAGSFAARLGIVAVFLAAF